MKRPAVGRNDPCPCGSGKKYKKCCLGKDEQVTPGLGAAEVSESLRQTLEEQKINSFEEVQAFVEQHTQQQNRRALDEFNGLTPEQMHRLLHFPFTSPQLVRFPEILDSVPKAPILSLFEMLVGAIGEQGLKPTAKGTLPRKFCREFALAYWGEHRNIVRIHGLAASTRKMILTTCTLHVWWRNLQVLFENTRAGSFSAGIAGQYWRGAV